MRILCIVPFQNEELHLDSFLASLAAQQRAPDQTLLVDDGSSDRSPRIAAGFAGRRRGVGLLRRPWRAGTRDRLVGAPELAEFQWAIEQAADDWELVVKLDADLVLS